MAELPFGFLNLLADRAGGDAQFVRGRAQGAQATDRFNSPQPGQMNSVQIIHIDILNKRRQTFDTNIQNNSLFLKKC